MFKCNRIKLASVKVKVKVKVAHLI